MPSCDGGRRACSFHNGGALAAVINTGNDDLLIVFEAIVFNTSRRVMIVGEKFLRCW
jgi:hypothetical protein